jgi:LmbE family N-acetylglucosaminyl deacetylase
MMNLEIKRHADEVVKLLFLGAHSDDIEIGCGGTAIRLIKEWQRVEVMWVVFCSSPHRRKEAEDSAHRILTGAESAKVIVKDFRDGFLPYTGFEVKESFEQLKERFQPDVIFTHYRHDLHQDHRLLSELTWNTYRNHLILEYEIPKYDGDLGSPNLFVPLEREICETKISTMLGSFASQESKHWFAAETFWGLMRLRGMESGSPTQFAEGFYARKVVL